MTKNDLVAVVGRLRPSAQQEVDFTLMETDGVGSIASWNSTLGAQPTADLLDSTLAAIKLAGYKAIQSGKIEFSYQNAAYNTPLAYMGTTFFTDADSQFKLLAAAWGYDKLGSVPEGFTWWDAAGTPVPMTLPDLDGLALAMLNSGNANFGKRKALLAAIAAATTVAAAQAVTW